jgi:hypothetical protein
MWVAMRAPNRGEFLNSGTLIKEEKVTKQTTKTIGNHLDGIYYQPFRKKRGNKSLLTRFTANTQVSYKVNEQLTLILLKDERQLNA